MYFCECLVNEWLLNGKLLFYIDCCKVEVRGKCVENVEECKNVIYNRF